jgi:hypothetical protein
MSLYWIAYNGLWMLALGAGAWIGFLVFRIIRLKKKISQENVAWRARRDAEWGRYQSAIAVWRTAVESYEAADRIRRDAAPLFYPLAPRPTASRIDVFGGTRDGWASLLATVGSSVLSSGGRILLLDFSERGIGGGISQLAAATDFPVAQENLSIHIDQLGLLEDIDSEDIAEILANALDVIRQEDASATTRMIDAEILVAVTTQLDPPLTFVRIAAALRVLQEPAKVDDIDILSPKEKSAIVNQIDELGVRGRIRNEIRYLRSCLERLAGREENTAVATAQPWWPISGLRIIETSIRDTAAARKEFIDQVLFQAALYQLRRRRGDVSRDLLVIAGGDRIGFPALESMARNAASSGIRLINFFEHIAGGTERLIGVGDSTTLIMQLGNAKEAEAAAEFVGRGHKFVFSQVTRRVGSSLTTGTSTSAGGSVTISETEGRSGSRGKSGKSSGWNRSVSVSQSEFWQNTESLSATDSRQDGTVLQRVYEFNVEPTQIQQLPPTAFVLVDSSLNDRRAALGDCNPGIILLPRVASTAHQAVPAGPQQQGAPLAIDARVVPPSLEGDDPSDRPGTINLMQLRDLDNG